VWRWFSESQLQVCKQLRSVNPHRAHAARQCCVDNDTVRRLGVTFDQFVCLGRCNGAVVDAHRACDVTLQQFRATVSAICGQQPMEKSSFLVSRFVHIRMCIYVCRCICIYIYIYIRIHISSKRSRCNCSYSRATFGQTGDGHWSPIGGYHAELDMVGPVSCMTL
jgi:glutathione gamma-glutamylcysteinyltransferase